jgi:hypothetical protein
MTQFPSSVQTLLEGIEWQNELCFLLKYYFTTTAAFSGKTYKEIAIFHFPAKSYFQFQLHSFQM